MRVNHSLARRPGEYRKASILGRNQGQRVVLVVDELRARKVSRRTDVSRRQYPRVAPLDRLRQRQLLDLR